MQTAKSNGLQRIQIIALSVEATVNLIKSIESLATYLARSDSSAFTKIKDARRYSHMAMFSDIKITVLQSYSDAKTVIMLDTMMIKAITIAYSI